MTPEERSLLERTHKLAEENNEMLRKIRRNSRWSLIMRGIYWGLIILIGIGAAWFIQPYVESTMDLYDEFQSNVDTVQNGANTFKELFQ